MRKLSLVLALTCLAMALMATAAFAAHNSTSTDFHTWDNMEAPNSALSNYPSYSCGDCHEGNQKRTSGPHGGYITTTKRCSTCHTIHSNIADNGEVGQSTKLLPGQTITQVCNFCHDLTGSLEAPYYTNYMTGSEMQSAHKVQDGMNYWTGGRKVGTGTWAAPEVAGEVYTLANPGAVVPGGNSATGGTLAYADLFQQGDWSGDSFTCDSCHTPHAITGSTVAPYFGESRRKDAGAGGYMYAGSRLLKKKLAVNGGTYANYGSQWCSGCHMGRLTMAGANNNHPVNTSGLGYNFGKVVLKTQGNTTPLPTVWGAAGATEAEKIAAINTGVLTGVASAANQAYALGIGADGTFSVNSTTIARYLSANPRLNSWYTMTSTDPLTGNTRPDGYIPISEFQSATSGVNGPSCQQCHASVRDVEAAFTEDTTIFSFPHIAKTQYLLVEDNTDDLCTNCHGLDNLP